MALSQDTHLFKVIDEELGIKSLQRAASNEINLYIGCYVVPESSEVEAVVGTTGQQTILVP